jgi:hypothetical protein
MVDCKPVSTLVDT